jgi:hypothetical protein
MDQTSSQHPSPENSYLHQRFSTALKILLVIGAALLAYEGQYQGAVETLTIAAITYLPQHLGSRLHVRIPPEFESLAVLFICMTLFCGEVLDFYNRYWWWDLVLHAGSGFLLGIVGFLLVYILNEKDSLNIDIPRGFIALFAFQFSVSLGVLWEIFEFAMDSLFGLNMQKSGLVDTMWDLIVDCLGALAISIMGYFYLLTVESDSFLEHWIDRFIASNPRLFRRHRQHERNQS